MKIGMFIDSYQPLINGIATSIDSLKSGLEKLGHEVYIIAAANTKKIEIKDNVISIPSIDYPYWNIRLINPYSKKSQSLIKDLNLDIVHTHSEGSVGYFGNIVKRKFNIANIHTAHFLYRDYKYYILNNKLHAGDIVEKILIKGFCNNCDALIFPSEKYRDYVISNFKLDKEPHVIYNGVDLYEDNNFNKSDFRNKLGISDDDFILLCPGRIAKEKNIEFLVEAQKKLEEDQNIKLMLIGYGPNLEYVKSIAPKSTIILGCVDHNQMFKYYKSADLTVSASTSETQGLTILESIKCSTPVLCINDMAFKYIVKNGDNGLIFNNQDEYINFVRSLRNNQKELLKLKINCLKYKDKYDSYSYAKNVEQVYEYVLNNK